MGRMGARNPENGQLAETAWTQTGRRAAVSCFAERSSLARIPDNVVRLSRESVEARTNEVFNRMARGERVQDPVRVSVQQARRILAEETLRLVFPRRHTLDEQWERSSQQLQAWLARNHPLAVEGAPMFELVSALRAAVAQLQLTNMNLIY